MLNRIGAGGGAGGGLPLTVDIEELQRRLLELNKQLTRFRLEEQQVRRRLE